MALDRSSRRLSRRGSFWTHLILIVAVLIVASPLLFALVKATQTSAQVTGPSLLIGVEFLSNAGPLGSVRDWGSTCSTARSLPSA